MYCVNRFKDGLAVGKLTRCIEQNPEGWKSLFMYDEKLNLTAVQVANLFKPQFAPEGSNKRRRENLTVSYWRDWLLEVEGEPSKLYFT